MKTSRLCATAGLFLVILLATSSVPVGAQSLYLKAGEHGVEASAGWSVGPSSHGIETYASVGINGRVDIGLAVSRYTTNFDDGSESSYEEYAPFVRVFLLKQQAGAAPASIALKGQVFVDDFGTDDSGHFVQTGVTIFKALKLTDKFALQPFGGFAFVAESYKFGGGPAENAQYLTRDLGVHFTTSTEQPWVLRFSLLEQSFRRETYRAARISVLHRL